MKGFPTSTFVAVGLSALFITWPALVAGGIKCWNNGEGVRECGNIVPPEYAQKSYRELNEHGVLIGQTPRAKTPEELEREQADRRKQAAEQAELSRIAQEQAKRDRVLLHTFTTEEDLVLARDGKIQTIEARIRHIESRIGKLDESLESLKSRAAVLERRGNNVPEELRKDITDIEREMADNRESIELWRAEQNDVRASFELDLYRFRELKAIERP
jgi:chromosome segregation ATPase